MNFSDDVLHQVGSEIDTPLTDETRSEIEATAWEWFQTSAAWTTPKEKTVLKTLLTAQWERDPRQWYVANCDLCEWMIGGWLTSDNATKVLRNHTVRKHKA